MNVLILFFLGGKCPHLTLHFRFPQNRTLSPIAVPLHKTGKLRKMSLLPSAGATFSDVLRKLREVSCHLLSKHFWVFIFANMCNCSILQQVPNTQVLLLRFLRLAVLRPSYRITFQMVIGSCLQKTRMCEECCGNRAFFQKRLACELLRENFC